MISEHPRLALPLCQFQPALGNPVSLAQSILESTFTKIARGEIAELSTGSEWRELA
jgi:hypothetical protein